MKPSFLLIACLLLLPDQLFGQRVQGHFAVGCELKIPKPIPKCVCWYRGAILGTLWDVGCQEHFPPGISCLTAGECPKLGQPASVSGPMRDQDFEDLQDSLFTGSDSSNLAAINTSKITAYHHFQMMSDSGISNYHISELTYNGNRIKWRDWIIDSVLRLPDTELGDSTTSESFTLSTGAKISFCRSFFWNDQFTLEPLTNNYYCDDNLDFSVVLIHKNSGQRLALLDSFSVLASATRSFPLYFSSHPLLAIREYAVPSQHNGKPAFIRVIPKATGNGDYLFTRIDSYGAGFADMVNDSAVLAFLADNETGWTPISYKPTEDSRSHATPPVVDVIEDKARERYKVILRGMDQARIDVSVLNSTGQRVRSQYASTGSSDSEITGELHITEPPGVYFIVVQQNGVNVTVQKILKDY